MMQATIVGNGETRRGIDLEQFRIYGPLFGANAIHRDLKVDWLIAIDDRIIAEIFESSFPRDRFIVPPVEEQYEPASYSPLQRRENAGMVAMREAIKRGYESLYCLGFDFLFEDEELNMGNIYNGTNAYGPETRASVADCANRTSYLDWFADKNAGIEFIFVYPEIHEGRKIRPVKSPNIKVAYI